MEFEYKITIPGCPRTKKNGRTYSFQRFDKRLQRLVNRPKPILIDKPAYSKWVTDATQALMVWKSKQKGVNFPLTQKMNMKCLFFMEPSIIKAGNDEYGVDLSALYEGIQDVMSGNGNHSVPAQYYQIIIDDNSSIIGSHDGSRVLLDLVRPRMEVTLTPFK